MHLVSTHIYSVSILRIHECIDSLELNEFFLAMITPYHFFYGRRPPYVDKFFWTKINVNQALYSHLNTTSILQSFI
jgi:hypothetical protein